MRHPNSVGKIVVALTWAESAALTFGRYWHIAAMTSVAANVRFGEKQTSSHKSAHPPLTP
jgi:hypothetical protein